MEDSTKEIVKKAANAVGSLKVNINKIQYSIDDEQIFALIIGR